MADMTPYSTAKPLLGALPQWIADEQERQRVAAYMLYEQIYWTVPDTFKLVQRGSEDKPIYIPSGRIIVETLHRYLAASPDIIPDPTFGTPNDQLLAQQVMDDLKKRERLLSRFNANKRYGIMRGDWAWHLYADPARPPGSRISILPVDPASLFPIYNPVNVDEIIGWHIVDQYVDDSGKPFVRRLTYRKQTGTGGPSPIEVTDELYKVDEWGGPGMDQEARPEQTMAPPQVLPSPIDDLPVYLIPNFQEPGLIWGSSEMRGLERIMAAVNQTISDEELALALEGLGVYATDAGTPVDDDDNEVGWNLGPGRVVELPDGKKMERITGVSSVTPSQAHLAYLHDMIDQTVGLSAVAKGRTSVDVAESGIALMLELAPLLARVAEKEQVVTDVMGNMLFNIGKWFSAYEGTAFNSLWEVSRWVIKYGPKIPPNRKAEFDELISLAGLEGVVPKSYIRTRLRKLGYEDMPDEATILAEIAAEQQQAADQAGARADAALGEELAAVGALNEGGNSGDDSGGLGA